MTSEGQDDLKNLYSYFRLVLSSVY